MPEWKEQLRRLVADFSLAGLSVSTAESLTGGLLAATLVDVPGASGMFYGGVVAYRNSVKVMALGVSSALLAERGAVDPEVACAMALGACVATGARVGISTTGVAGPERHQGKQVGEVYLGVALDGAAIAYEFHFSGDRASIRQQAVEEALVLLGNIIAEPQASGREQKLSPSS